MSGRVGSARTQVLVAAAALVLGLGGCLDFQQAGTAYCSARPDAPACAGGADGGPGDGGAGDGGPPDGGGGDGGETPAAPGVRVQVAGRLTTREASATDDSFFTVVLTAPPTGDVLVEFESSDPGEGVPHIPSVTFRVGDWSEPRTVWARGVNDAEADGKQAYTILVKPALSSDPRYQGLDGDDVQVENLDDETAQVGVSAALVQLQEQEFSQPSATVQVSLSTAPAGPITIPVSVSDAAQLSVSTEGLTFTPANWAQAQPVTVTLKLDQVAEGPQDYTLRLGAINAPGTPYHALDPQDVTVRVLDDDAEGVRWHAFNQPLATYESSPTQRQDLYVCLNSRPTADVTLTFSSSKLEEGRVEAPQGGVLTITPAGWVPPTSFGQCPTVSLVGVNDDVDDDPVNYDVTFTVSSADPRYAALTGFLNGPATVSNRDDDVADLVVRPVFTAPLLTSASGAADRFRVSLASQPRGTVAVDVSRFGSAGGVTFSPRLLLFTESSWKQGFEVTATGPTSSGSQDVDWRAEVGVTSAPDDAAYQGLSDNSLTGVTYGTSGFRPVYGLGPANSYTQTAQANRFLEDAFSIRLGNPPMNSDDVSVRLCVTPGSPLSLGSSSVCRTLLFNQFNWNNPQAIDVSTHTPDGPGELGTIEVDVEADPSSGYGFLGQQPPLRVWVER